MDEPLISIIVPAYNAQEFLPQCIDSILGQTHARLELIIVDDGSTDDTARIVNRYSNADPRVRLIQKENGGQSTARNVGIEAAKGEYIAFVDADDEVDTLFLQTCLRAMMQNDAQIASCNYQRGNAPKWPAQERRPIVMSTADAIEHILYQRKGLNGSICAHLFRADNVWKERFTEGLWYEDLDYSYRVYLHARTAVHIPEAMYFYRDVQGSFINTFSERRLDVLTVVDRIEERFIDESVLAMAAADRKFAANFNMFVLCSRQGHPKAQDCWKQIKAYRWRILTNAKSRMKNRVGALVSFLGRKATMAVASIAYHTS